MRSAGDCSSVSRGEDSALRQPSAFGESFVAAIGSDNCDFLGSTSSCVVFCRAFLCALRGDGAGDSDGDDRLDLSSDLRGDDGALSLVADVFVFDIPDRRPNANFGIRDLAPPFPAAVSLPLTAEEVRRTLHSCVPLPGTELAVSPSLLRVFDTSPLPSVCWGRVGILDSLRGNDDEVSAGLLG